jgi:transcriptional regulator with XRE-family HTH domain
MTVPEIFAFRLRIERNLNGWSQTEVANQLELGRNTTYSNWERGIKMPNAETIVKLANLYKVSVDYLFGRINERDFELRNKIAHGRVLDFSDKEVLDVYEFMLDGKVITKDQSKRLIAYIRAERTIPEE